LIFEKRGDKKQAGDDLSLIFGIRAFSSLVVRVHFCNIDGSIELDSLDPRARLEIPQDTFPILRAAEKIAAIS
jgi:hypothetical protein